jgi:acyl-CoA thioester hydrolase
MTDFTHEIEIHLRFRDIDELGHLTHSVYHDFLAEARVSAMEAALPPRDFPFVLAHVEIDYRHEVRRSDQRVTIHTAIGRVGKRSVTLPQEVRLPDGTLAAEASATLVAWDADERAARDLTDAERAALGA